jgi:hypothetical protein
VSKQIANAILNTTNPKALTAIASIESNFDPNAVGDHGLSIGMFQIRKDLHGLVRRPIHLQAKKAQEVLFKCGSVRRYNGGGKAARQYEAKVNSIIKEIP